MAIMALMVAMSASAMAQAGTTKVTGVVKDEAGQPMAGVTVELTNKEIGRKIPLKTDKKGQFYSLGVNSGSYKVVVTGTDGKVIWTIDNIAVKLTPEDLVTINIDMAKEKKAAASDAQKQMTPEQKKELERVSKENTKIGSLNKMLADGQAALEAGNYDQAIATFQQAAAADPTRDLLWARLGDAHNTIAKKTTDPA
ncbi:MAG TPA: carboxypeptidase regulatory-like domain-containing protein, partial [Terriglobales bacterium]|nr:carboxypeptidase regulatory-like domain-containing protein [Terriglobales bacterium]